MCITENERIRPGCIQKLDLFVRQDGVTNYVVEPRVGDAALTCSPGKHR